VQALREGLRRVMEQHGLRPNSWARRAGVDGSSLVRFIRGETGDIKCGYVYRLAEAVGLPGPDAIAGITGEARAAEEREIEYLRLQRRAELLERILHRLVPDQPVPAPERDIEPDMAADEIASGRRHGVMRSDLESVLDEAEQELTDDARRGDQAKKQIG